MKEMVKKIRVICAKNLANVTPEDKGEYLKCSECEQTIWLSLRMRENMVAKQKDHEIRYTCQECGFKVSYEAPSLTT